ncbi:MAG: hypothetical protein K9L74_06065 [Candidatus Izimaplasma sp.]|nr:hypothetical protein [Candidatus Izimaplasma bacterium]
MYSKFLRSLYAIIAFPYKAIVRLFGGSIEKVLDEKHFAIIAPIIIGFFLLNVAIYFTYFSPFGLLMVLMYTAISLVFPMVILYMLRHNKLLFYVAMTLITKEIIMFIITIYWAMTYGTATLVNTPLNILYAIAYSIVAGLIFKLGYDARTSIAKYSYYAYGVIHIAFIFNGYNRLISTLTRQGNLIFLLITAMGYTLIQGYVIFAAFIEDKKTYKRKQLEV